MRVESKTRAGTRPTRRQRQPWRMRFETNFGDFVILGISSHYLPSGRGMARSSLFELALDHWNGAANGFDRDSSAAKCAPLRYSGGCWDVIVSEHPHAGFIRWREGSV